MCPTSPSLASGQLVLQMRFFWSWSVNSIQSMAAWLLSDWRKRVNQTSINQNSFHLLCTSLILSFLFGMPIVFRNCSIELVWPSWQLHLTNSCYRFMYLEPHTTFLTGTACTCIYCSQMLPCRAKKKHVIPRRGSGGRGARGPPWP